MTVNTYLFKLKKLIIMPIPGKGIDPHESNVCAKSNTGWYSTVKI